VSRHPYWGIESKRYITSINLYRSKCNVQFELVFLFRNCKDIVNQEGRDPGSTNMSQKTAYYKTRLNHTIKHNQEFTRLIYLVNAGILAFLAFLWKEVLPNSPNDEKFNSLSFTLTITAFFSLFVINVLHVLFIQRQGIWYRELRQSYWKLIGRGTRDEITVQTRSIFKRISVTYILMAIHATVAIVFLIVIIKLFIFRYEIVKQSCFFELIHTHFS
jgi:hypothetical protein